MPRAQFHLRYARPSIRTEGSPAVLAMRGREPRRSIHHHSLLSAVGREVQLDVVHTGGCDALPGGLELCCGDVDRQPGRTARPSPPLRAWKCKAAADIEHSFAWPQLGGVEHRLTGWGEECFVGVAELLVLPRPVRFPSHPMRPAGLPVSLATCR
jgi:hypothetical protein